MNRSVAEGVLASAEGRRADAVQEIARRLRETAEEVARLGQDGRYTQIVHTVVWGLANANLDALVRADREVAVAQSALDHMEPSS